MKALWTAPRVTFKSRYWQLEGAAMEPKSMQKPHPPVWFGAGMILLTPLFEETAQVEQLTADVIPRMLE